MLPNIYVCFELIYYYLYITKCEKQVNVTILYNEQLKFECNKDTLRDKKTCSPNNCPSRGNFFETQKYNMHYDTNYTNANHS